MTIHSFVFFICLVVANFFNSVTADSREVFSCSFDDDACGLQLSQPTDDATDDELRWYRRQEITLSNGTVLYDHTNGAKQHQGVLLYAGGGDADSVTIIDSDADISCQTALCCFNAYALMSQSQVSSGGLGSLVFKIVQNSYGDQPVTTILANLSFNSYSNYWTSVQHTFPANSKPFRISIEARNGGGGREFFVAVDDISVRTGMCQSDARLIGGHSTGDCGDAPTVIGGVASLSRGKTVSAPKKASYSCLMGYDLVGPETSTCLLNGRWSSAPVCTPVRGSYYKGPRSFSMPRTRVVTDQVRGVFAEQRETPIGAIGATIFSNDCYWGTPFDDSAVRSNLGISSAQLFLFPNQPIACSGQVIRWAFLITQVPDETPVYLSIWRPLKGTTNQYQLAGHNQFTAKQLQQVIQYVVPGDERIEAKPGDIIGIIHKETSTQGTIYVYDSDHLPPGQQASDLFQVSTMSMHIEDISPGQIVTATGKQVRFTPVLQAFIGNAHCDEQEVPGVTFSGIYTVVGSIKSKDECWNYCRKQPECYAISFHTDTNDCHYYSYISDEVHFLEDLVSLIRSCSTDCGTKLLSDGGTAHTEDGEAQSGQNLIVADGDRAFDLQIIGPKLPLQGPANFESDCEIACRYTPACVAFSYANPFRPGTCTLFSNMTSVIRLAGFRSYRKWGCADVRLLGNCKPCTITQQCVIGLQCLPTGSGNQKVCATPGSQNSCLSPTSPPRRTTGLPPSTTMGITTPAPKLANYQPCADSSQCMQGSKCQMWSGQMLCVPSIPSKTTPRRPTTTVTKTPATTTPADRSVPDNQPCSNSRQCKAGSQCQQSSSGQMVCTRPGSNNGGPNNNGGRTPDNQPCANSQQCKAGSQCLLSQAVGKMVCTPGSPGNNPNGPNSNGRNVADNQPCSNSQQCRAGSQCLPYGDNGQLVCTPSSGVPRDPSGKTPDNQPCSSTQQCRSGSRCMPSRGSGQMVCTPTGSNSNGRPQAITPNPSQNSGTPDNQPCSSSDECLQGSQCLPSSDNGQLVCTPQDPQGSGGPNNGGSNQVPDNGPCSSSNDCMQGSQCQYSSDSGQMVCTNPTNPNNNGGSDYNNGPDGSNGGQSNVPNNRQPGGPNSRQPNGPNSGQPNGPRNDPNSNGGRGPNRNPNDPNGGWPRDPNDDPDSNQSGNGPDDDSNGPNGPNSGQPTDPNSGRNSPNGGKPNRQPNGPNDGQDNSRPNRNPNNKPGTPPNFPSNNGPNNPNGPNRNQNNGQSNGPNRGRTTGPNVVQPSVPNGGQPNIPDGNTIGDYQPCTYQSRCRSGSQCSRYTDGSLICMPGNSNPSNGQVADCQPCANTRQCKSGSTCRSSSIVGQSICFPGVGSNGCPRGPNNGGPNNGGSDTCPDPPRIAKGYVLKYDKRAVMPTATYACDDGYEILGSPNVYCENQVWQVPYPVCRPSCPNLPNVQNGQVSEVPTSTIGKLATVRCNSGYKMVGSAMVVCLNSYNWSSVPSCVSDCGSPPEVVNGFWVVTQGTQAVPRVVRYSCANGFVMSGLESNQCFDSAWTSPGPTCRPQAPCPSAPPLVNGAVLATGTFINKSVIAYATYGCMSGFQLVGRPTIFCRDSNKWDKLPSCAAFCGSVPAVENSKARILGYSNGQPMIVKYECLDGYKMDGEPMTSCISQLWTSVPKCLPKGAEPEDNCGQPPDIENGGWSALSGSSDAPIAVQFYCNDGYNLIGPTNLVCVSGDDGPEWQPPVLPCCRPPVGFSFGFNLPFLPQIPSFSLPSVSLPSFPDIIVPGPGPVVPFGRVPLVNVPVPASVPIVSPDWPAYPVDDDNYPPAPAPARQRPNNNNNNNNNKPPNSRVIPVRVVMPSDNNNGAPTPSQPNRNSPNDDDTVYIPVNIGNNNNAPPQQAGSPVVFGPPLQVVDGTPDNFSPPSGNRQGGRQPNNNNNNRGRTPSPPDNNNDVDNWYPSNGPDVGFLPGYRVVPVGNGGEPRNNGNNNQPPRNNNNGRPNGGQNPVVVPGYPTVIFGPAPAPSRNNNGNRNPNAGGSPNNRNPPNNRGGRNPPNNDDNDNSDDNNNNNPPSDNGGQQPMRNACCDRNRNSFNPFQPFSSLFGGLF